VLQHFPVDFKFLFVPGRSYTVFAQFKHTALISSYRRVGTSGAASLDAVLFQFYVQEIRPTYYSWLVQGIRGC
jgi:hypothetical protein